LGLIDQQAPDNGIGTDTADAIPPVTDEVTPAAAGEEYGKDTVAVIVWEPGFHADTGEVIHKPRKHVTNRVDWEGQARRLDPEDEKTVLEHLGLYVVKVLHLPNGCTEPKINQQYLSILKDRKLI